MTTGKPIYKIDKGVPMPMRRRGGGVHTAGPPMVYPFDKMEITDSIFVPAGQEWKGIHACAIQYARRHGIRFEMRTVVDGVRIWRTA